MIYDFILDGWAVDVLSGDSEDILQQYINGCLWGEMEKTDQVMPKYSRLILTDTVNGIAAYYDYGADYYFFKDLEG
jgi:hypothetical protein